MGTPQNRVRIGQAERGGLGAAGLATLDGAADRFSLDAPAVS
jgi:hypothetical protein